VSGTASKRRWLPGKRQGLLIDCDRIWSGLVTWSYRVRRKPRVTNSPPPIRRR
jgi:hypothetical protein